MGINRALKDSLRGDSLEVIDGGQALDLDSELLKFLLDASSEFIIEHDVEGRIIAGSPSAAAALGYGSHSLVGIAFDRVGDQEYRESVNRCFKVASDQVQVLEGCLLKRDGTPHRVRGMARVLGVGSEARLVASLRPVESQDPQGLFTHAQKLEAIGQLAAGIAHEINTPTQYVGDNVRFLQDAFTSVLDIQAELLSLADRLQDLAEFSEQVASIRSKVEAADLEYISGEIPLAITQTLEGVEQIARIVRAMKEFSHPDRDEKRLVQINSAIDSTVTVAKNEWKYVADVEKDLDPALPMIPLLAGEFNQVLLNLLVNAAHAIEEVNGGGSKKGTITISTRKIEESVEIRIADTGAGIPEFAQSRIFDPFYTTKEVGKGTGQGLSLAYNTVVEKHGGTIHFETEIGSGTTFVVTLPIPGAGQNQ
jgi:signal transduction histidine kinase